jgi:Flp pilus assembly protein TadD
MAFVTDFERRRTNAARGACVAAASMALCVGLPAAAQQPAAAIVAQPSATAGVQDLNKALDDLTRAPNDVSAMLRAGWASLALGDTQASLGFFRRAEQAAPTNGEAKAGEASADLRLHNPVDAVRLFSAAETAGVPMAKYAGDRGLALDLLGENAAAQQFYRQALAFKYDPEVVRRLALSQAISGDQRGSEATLLPLLQKQDLISYRTRAFALAILGKGEEAVSIAEKMLPADLSNRMAPYLRYMPRLTRAQQAAAANLGEFPPANEIGRDSPQIAALSAQNATPQVAERDPGSRLVPSGQPLGRNDGDRGKQRREKPAKSKDKAKDKSSGRASTTYTPQPAPQQAPPPLAAPAPAPVPTPAPASQASVELPPVPRQTAPQPVVVATLDQQRQQPAPAPPAAAVEQTVSKPVVVATLDQQPAPASDARTVEQAPRPLLSIGTPARVRAATDPVSLADAFAAFSKPISPSRPTPGAVDITKIKPAREAKPKPEPKPAAKPRPPTNPSRVWVQIGTGRNVNALAFTWRRLSKKGGALLARHDAYTAKWGRTRRLVTGPYKDEDEAQAAIKALKKKGINSFEFVSDEGEQVTPLE